MYHRMTHQQQLHQCHAGTWLSLALPVPMNTRNKLLLWEEKWIWAKIRQRKGQVRLCTSAIVWNSNWPQPVQDICIQMPPKDHRSKSWTHFSPWFERKVLLKLHNQLLTHRDAEERGVKRVYQIVYVTVKSLGIPKLLSTSLFMCFSSLVGQAINTWARMTK